MAAIEAGCDIVDGAVDSMSGLTSQPNLGSIVSALKGTSRDPKVDQASLRSISHYWEGVRRYYSPFESEIRSGTSDVYRHEMPGGQYTNLREQARSMGIEHRWLDISAAYAQVNLLFGDIVKVTPTSKVVGDMALFMVASGLTFEDVLDPGKEISFPESVVQLMRGELGFPVGGFPEVLQRKVLKEQKPMKGRPSENMSELDLEKEREKVQVLIGHEVNDQQLASYLMYPKVYQDYSEYRSQFGDVSGIPTSAYFYGLRDQEEIAVLIDQGKTLHVRIEGRAPADDEGQCRLFFELNGQPRLVRVPQSGVKITTNNFKQAEEGNLKHVSSPMPGSVTKVVVKEGQKVSKGDVLASIEAMKMESLITAERDGIVSRIYVKTGQSLPAKALVMEMT